MCAALLGLIACAPPARVPHRVLRGVLSGRRIAFGANHQAGCGSSIEARVDVAGAGHFKACEALDGAERGHDLLRNDLGRFAKFAGQLKGNGSGDFAEAEVGRRLQRKVFKLKIVFFFQNRANLRAEPLLQFQNHVELPQKSLIFLGDSNRSPMPGQALSAKATTTKRHGSRSRGERAVKQRATPRIAARTGKGALTILGR